jgi:hypothetical protein
LVVRTSHLHLDVSLCSAPGVGREPRLQRMEWQSRGRARRRPNRQPRAPLTLARGSPIRRLLMTRRLSGGIRAAPTSAGLGGRNESRGLRAATGWVATARNPRLARKQPPGHLRFRLAGSAAAATVQGCRGAQHMAREGECGTSRTESEERCGMRLISDIVLKGLVF